MKKLLHFLALGALLCIPWVTQGQTVTIGSGTATSTYLPGYNYYKYAISQQIYTAEEINASGTITSISFYKDGTQNSNGSRKFDIYMAHTTKSSFNSSSDWIALTDADIVYHGTANYSFTNNAWNTFTLETPFNYNGTDNLVVCVIDRTGNYSSSSSTANAYRIFSTGSEYQAIYKNSDTYSSLTPDGHNGTTEIDYSRLQSKNQIVLGGIQQTCAIPTDLAASLDATDHTIATLNWTENGEATSWVLQVATNNTFTEGLNSYNVSATPSKDLTGLTPETKYYARVRPSCSETLWSDVCEFKPTATVTVPIGDGTSSNYDLPVNTYYNYSLTQQIYTAAEIQAGGGSAGTINSISFYHDYANTTPQTMNGIKAYLLNTDKDAFTSSTDMVAITDADKVWEGNITLNGQGWVTIDFTTPFEYEGDNLIVCLYYPTYEYPGSSYKFRYTATTYYSAVEYHSDGTCPDLNNINTFSDNKNYRQYHNNIQLGIVPSATPKPKNLHVVDNSLSSTGATLAWIAPTTATPTGYEYQYKTSTAEWPTDWTDNGTNLSVTLNTLTASTPYTFRVRAIYDGVGESDPVETSFTTLDNCAFPTNLVATTTPGQGTKATLTWVKGYDEEAWVLEYATNNTFTEGLVEMTTGFTVEGNNVTANLTGLTAETHYYARVKATCSATSSSTWSNVVDFTPTNYVDFTYNETATSSTSYVPFYYYTTYSTNQSQYIIPAASLADVVGGQIRSITYYTSSTATTDFGGAEFDVYMTEVEQAAFSTATFIDWTTLGTPVYSGTVSLSNQKMTITFDNDYSYAGGNLLIGFKTTTAGTTSPSSFSWTATYNSSSYTQMYQYGSNSASRSYYQPKVTLNYQPTTTPRPIITEPVTTTDVTATIAWTKPSDNVTGYKYQYKLAADTWSDDWTNLNDADVLSVMLPGLTPNSSYNFRMKAVYGTEESFVSSTSFVTECPAATAVPYSYGFETASEFSCWEVIAGAAIADHTSSQPTHDGTTGSKHLKFSGTTSNMVALPAFGEATNTLRITLWTRPENITNSSCGSFSIGYMTNLADASTFTPIATYDYDDWSEFEYEKKIVDFNDPNDNVPANAYIALCQHDCSSSWYWFVDDVKVKVIPTCEDVNDVHYVSFTNHSATIAWTADAAQTAWQIAYKAGANFNPNNAEELATAIIVDVTSNPYLFDKNLEAATTYYMYVRGNCTASSNGYGDWSDTYATFTTSAADPAPSAFTASNIASTKVDLVWNAGGGDYEESWELYYVPSTTAPEAPTLTTEATKIVNVLPTTLAPYELTGLTAENKYYIWVRANHGTDGKSAWVALTGDFFNTLAACSAQDPVVSAITHHNATVTWDGESADGFTVKYREAAHIDGISEEFNTSNVPEGWTKYTGLLSDVMGGTATLSTTTYGWNFSNTNVFGAYHTKLNIYGTSCKYWLVTPNVNLANGSTLQFDLALTDYDSEAGLDVPTGQADDKFVVLITTDNMENWSILREWNNSGSEYIYNNIPNTADNHITIDLSAYTGDVKIAFYGESTVSASNEDNDLHIDNVTIGVTVPVGDWQTKAATTTTADLTGLTAGTKYDLKVVPNCDETLESSTVQFTTLPANNKYFLTAGDWNTASNWMDEEMPTTTDNAIIRANATIPNGTVATAKNITFEGTPTLTLADGGQLIANNSVSLTVQKSATANSWMGISAPVFSSYSSSYLNYTSSTNLKEAGAYDLMQYTESSSTWQSQKSTSYSYMSQERGYIYRRADATTLTFTGSTHVGNQSASVVTWSASDASLKGFNLIGNPYPHAIYYGAAIPTTNLAAGFYILQTNGTWRTVAGADINTTAIGVGDAILVKASDAISPFEMTDVATAPTSSKAHTATLAFTVSNDEYSDVAYAMFSNGEGLPKMSHLNAEAPMLYIPTDEGRYAIAMMEESVESFPLNFNGYGEYTLSMNNSTAFGYLHLIDRATGRDIDLLSQSTYTFNANGSSDRFTVKLSPSMEENGRAIFVWQENGNVVIEGDGDLQVFDVMGRQTGTTHVDGTTTFSRGDLGMSHSGVYVLRLNGNSQKIVVK